MKRPQVLGGRSSTFTGAKQLQRAVLPAVRSAARMPAVKNIAEPPAKEAPVTSKMNGSKALSPVAVDINNKLKYQLGKIMDHLGQKDVYQGSAWAVREQLIDAFDKTHDYWK